MSITHAIYPLLKPANESLTATSDTELDIKNLERQVLFWAKDELLAFVIQGCILSNNLTNIKAALNGSNSFRKSIMGNSSNFIQKIFDRLRINKLADLKGYNYKLSIMIQSLDSVMKSLRSLYPEITKNSIRQTCVNLFREINPENFATTATILESIAGKRSAPT